MEKNTIKKKLKISVALFHGNFIIYQFSKNEEISSIEYGTPKPWSLH